MIILEDGHVYNLQQFPGVKGSSEPDNSDNSFLTFCNNETDAEHDGTNNQEVLRALIDRVQYLDEKLQHKNNPEIVFHLRKALVLHESRALERKVDKGKLNPENVATDDDGHFVLSELS